MNIIQVQKGLAYPKLPWFTQDVGQGPKLRGRCRLGPCPTEGGTVTQNHVNSGRAKWLAYPKFLWFSVFVGRNCCRLVIASIKSNTIIKYHEHAKRFILALMTLVLFVFSVASHAAYSPLNVELIEKSPSLSVYPMPVQKGLINSNFNLNLKQYLSVMSPDVYYRVTNTAQYAIGAFFLFFVPGVTPLNPVDNCFTKSIVLLPNESCTVGIHIDPSSVFPKTDVKICAAMLPACRRLPSGHRLPDLVERLQRPRWPVVTSSVLDGLSYDPATMSIIGKPERTGLYQITVGASDGFVNAEPQILTIDVALNPKDKPVFKKQSAIASAVVGQAYRLDLMTLVEPVTGFMVSNQIRFRVDPEKPAPAWLTFDQETSTILTGHVPVFEVDQTKAFTIIATSNTGGDSLPLTIQIPVAFDLTKRPAIKSDIELPGEAGHSFEEKLDDFLIDPSADGSLKLVLDKVEPAAPWLVVVPTNPTMLKGDVPEGVEGQHFQVILHANTATGGDSEAVTIPMNIKIDKNQTPHFYTANPLPSIVYAGQPYSYDFVDHHDITPEYEKTPYVVAFAKGYDNPSWLRIENNKLIANRVPDQINDLQKIWITISNIPGGESPVFPLELTIMN